jgi:hypothetical protein
MAFRAVKENFWPDVRSKVITDSQTLSIGEMIIPAAGTVDETSSVSTAGGTTGLVLGVVVGFKDKAGHALEENTIVAEADNMTDKLIKAIYLPCFPGLEWESDLDAAAGTTDESSSFGNFAVDSTGLLVDESSYVAFGTRSAVQMFSMGLTGKNTTQVTVFVFASVFGAQS